MPSQRVRSHVIVLTPGNDAYSGTYIAFIIIMFVGSAATWLILPANLVIRPDDTVVKLEKQSTVASEIHGFVQTLKDWRMLLRM